VSFNYTTWKQDAEKKKKENKQFLARAKRIKRIESELPDLHEEAFSKIDCLQCAGCCKTISPRFKTPDIVRISKFLGMKQGDMIDTYLRLDEDGDYVVKKSPCPFLGSDNYCSIYEARPAIAVNIRTPIVENFLSTRILLFKIPPHARLFIMF
jgi:uncharacterized protein